MPRQERPLESEDTPLLRFAGDLRRLRLRAGRPSYRELGKRTNYSAAAVSDALSGRRLPTLAVTVAVVRACRGDVEAWTSRWHELAAAQPGSTIKTISPYVGLAPYQVGDSDRFFGREALTDTVAALIEERPFVAVFGSSGAGKSSLLRAGVLARARRATILVTPGADPITELAVAVAGLAEEPVDRVHRDLTTGPEALRGWLAKAADDLLLVVDQFEETFTLCDDAMRTWLIRALTTATGPHARVVIGVRADFYDHCARHHELVTALHGAQVMVGPMSTEELRAAITEPAARAGATTETALVARLISDVAGQPGALPLVSHILAEAWQRRRGIVLTLTSYEALGGIDHALARTAENVFEKLPDDDRQAARLLFLRLVAPGNGTADTKRRVRRADLPMPDALLDRLADARLITIDRDSVELTHEALLRAWPRLAGWIARDREDIRTEHRLAEAAAVWEANGRDTDALYRGALLESAVHLRSRLNPGERDFLDAGLEAEQARARADQRVTRRLRRLAIGLTALAVLLAGTAVVAASAQYRATQQRDEALSLRGADAARDLIASRPRDAAALALAAYRIAPSAEARDTLLLAHAAVGATVLGRGFTHPPGRFAVTYDERTLGERLWRREGGSWSPAAVLPTANTYLHVYSTDEQRAIYWAGKTVSVLWDLTDLDHPRRVPAPDDLGMLDSMDRTGSVLSAVGTDKTARIWRAGDAGFRRLPAGDVVGTAVLDDGSGVVLSRQDGDQDTIERWTLDGRRIATLLRVPHPAVLEPGPGGLLAVTSYSDPVDMVIVDAADPQAPRIVARADGLDDSASASFDPGGRAVAVTDGVQIRIWDTATGRDLLKLRSQSLRLNSPRLTGDQLSVLDDRSRLWLIDPDLDSVIHQTCVRPAAVDWNRYFPGTASRQLCP